MKYGALLLTLSTLSTLMLSGVPAHAQHYPMTGARLGKFSSRPMSPPPPAIANPIRPSANPVVPPAVAVPPMSLLSPLRPSSPFEARPRTYAPRYDPRFGRIPGYPGGFIFDDATQVPSPDAAFPIDSNGQSAAYPPPQTPPVVVLPHAPDTYYVIPGCYMGNHPPNKDTLPKGCDVAKMKTMPVR